MTEEQIKEVYNYIMTHIPQETEIKTIDVAIRAVAGDCSLATQEDLVNQDDAWLIPVAERGKFAGVKGKGWAQSLSVETIRMLEEAARYSMQRTSESKKNDTLDDIQELKQLRNTIKNNMFYGNNNLNNVDENQYMSDNNMNKISK